MLIIVIMVKAKNFSRFYFILFFSMISRGKYLVGETLDFSEVVDSMVLRPVPATPRPPPFPSTFFFEWGKIKINTPEDS